jgi:hypothetical protein
LGEYRGKVIHIVFKYLSISRGTGSFFISLGLTVTRFWGMVAGLWVYFALKKLAVMRRWVSWWR